MGQGRCPDLQGLANRAKGKTVNRALPIPSDFESRKRLGQPGLRANDGGGPTRGSRPLLPIFSPTGRRRFGGPGPPGRFRPPSRARAAARKMPDIRFRASVPLPCE